jgi:hypothetical protein
MASFRDAKFCLLASSFFTRAPLVSVQLPSMDANASSAGDGEDGLGWLGCPCSDLPPDLDTVLRAEETCICFAPALDTVLWAEREGPVTTCTEKWGEPYPEGVLGST